MLERELDRLRKIQLTPTEEINKILEELGSTHIKTGTSLYDLIRRPELKYEELAILDKEREKLPREIRLQVETQIKYEGYIKKQMAQIGQFKKN